MRLFRGCIVVVVVEGFYQYCHFIPILHISFFFLYPWFFPILFFQENYGLIPFFLFIQ